jgi:hypothetical protein
MKTDEYHNLAKAVSEAGFFTNGVEDHGTWHRTCVCSKRAENGAYHGNSFWVSLLNGRCFLGVWGGWEYLLKDQSRLAELCITWLRRAPNGTRPDFDAQLKDEFRLVRLPEGEFAREAAADR